MAIAGALDPRDSHWNIPTSLVPPKKNLNMATGDCRKLNAVSQQDGFPALLLS